MRRRRFLRLVALGGLTVAAGHELRLGRRIRRWLDTHKSRVALVPCEGYGKELPAAVDRAMTLGDFPNVSGRTVLIKPNLIDYRPGKPLTTDPALVATIAQQARRRGATHVIVGEGPGNRRDIETVLAQTGLGERLAALSIPFVDLNTDDLVSVEPRTLPLDDPSRLGPRLLLPRSVVDGDVLVVSVAKLKTHHWSGLTLSMKNLFGVVPGVRYGWPKNILHWNGLDRSILELYLTVKPGFSIVDAVVAMEGEGPLDGTAREVGALVAGRHAPAVDATAAELAGVRPDALIYLRAVDAMDLGDAIPSRIDVVGGDPERLRRRLVLPRDFAHLGG